MIASGNLEAVRVERLKDRSQFLKIAASGIKWVAPGLVMQVRSLQGDSDSHNLIRIGFTTSKKVGNAVERNRARRRLRELAREIIPARSRPGYEYVLIGRKATINRAYDKLRLDLETALKRLKTVRDKPEPQA